MWPFKGKHSSFRDFLDSLIDELLVADFGLEVARQSFPNASLIRPEVLISKFSCMLICLTRIKDGYKRNLIMGHFHSRFTQFAKTKLDKNEQVWFNQFWQTRPNEYLGAFEADSNTVSTAIPLRMIECSFLPAADIADPRWQLVKKFIIETFLLGLSDQIDAIAADRSIAW